MAYLSDIPTQLMETHARVVEVFADYNESVRLVSERLTNSDCDKRGLYWIYLWRLSVGDRLFRWIVAIGIIYMPMP